MSPSPDESRFTACVVGESLPEELAAFELALQQDPALHREAGALHRTARHLAAALKKEPALMLTMAQRQAVLEPGRGIALTKKPARPVWWDPTLATAGIAAAVAVGAFFLPAPTKSPAPSARAPGIPAVSIQSVPASKAGHKPVLPPPSVATGSGLPGTLPAASGLHSPAVLPRPGSMAAVPPVLEVPGPVPPGDPKATLNPPLPPVRLAPGKLAPGEALGSGPPR